MKHLDDTTLARLRGDEERDEDAEAFRHLASCAVCRARMIEDPAVVRALTAPKTAVVVPLEARRVNGRTVVLVSGVLSVAAIIVIMVLAMKRAPEVAPIAVRTKSYAGTMGSTAMPSASVAPRDLNYEIAFDAPATSAARLLVIDSAGRLLTAMSAFERSGGELRAVVAPRTFAAHTGESRAIVLSGPEAKISAATKEIESALALGPLVREELAAIALRHALATASVTLP